MPESRSLARSESAPLNAVTVMPPAHGGSFQMSYTDVTNMAEAIVRSGMFGFKDHSQAIVLMLLAQSEGCHPIDAVRQYHIIQGRPAMRADAMLARFQNAGGRVEWITRTDTEVTAKFSHSAGGEVEVTWTIETAKRAGLLSKQGGNWGSYPRQMLTARVVSEGIRTVLPGVIVGIYTPEEVSQFEPLEQTERPAQPARSTAPASSGANTVAESDKDKAERQNLIQAFVNAMGEKGLDVSDQQERKTWTNYFLFPDGNVPRRPLTLEEWAKAVEMAHAYKPAKQTEPVTESPDALLGNPASVPTTGKLTRQTPEARRTDFDDDIADPFADTPDPRDTKSPAGML